LICARWNVMVTANRMMERVIHHFMRGLVR